MKIRTQFVQMVERIFSYGVYKRIVTPELTNKIRDKRANQFALLVTLYITLSFGGGAVSYLLSHDSTITIEIAILVALIGAVHIVWFIKQHKEIYEIKLLFRIKDPKNHFTVKFIRRTKIHTFFVSRKNEVTYVGSSQGEVIDVQQIDFCQLLTTSTPLGPEFIYVAYFVRSKVCEGGFTVDVIPMSNFTLDVCHYGSDNQITQSLDFDLYESGFRVLLPQGWNDSVMFPSTEAREYQKLMFKVQRYIEPELSASPVE